MRIVNLSSGSKANSTFISFGDTRILIDAGLPEKQLCEKYLLEQIKIVQPKVIVLCGATSAKSFLGKKIKISEIRGKWFKLFDNIDATVILHPSFLLRKHSEEDDSPRGLTRQDLTKIKEFINK